MSYRLRTIERDLSGFVSQEENAVAFTVIKARKGESIPRRNTGELDILTRYGKPDPDHFGVYECIDYSRVAPLWVVTPVGTGALYAGVDVRTDEVISFGTNAGRDMDTFLVADYESIEINETFTIAASGDGITANYTGDVTTTLPITAGSVKIKVGASYVDATDGDPNTLTGTAIDGTGTLDKDTGDYDFTFSGTPGTVATYTTVIDLSANVDLSSGGTDKKVRVTIDQNSAVEVNFGSGAATTQAQIIAAINAALGYTAAAVSGNFVEISGRIGSKNLGKVQIANPSSGSSALTLIFDLNATSPILSQNSTSPTGSIPQAGQQIILDYTYTEDVSTMVSHSLYNVSQFDDTFELYAVQVTNTKNSAGEATKRYKADLYKVENSRNVFIKTYNYSLIREKDSFGRSLYYEDVFKDDLYLKIFVNTAYTQIADPVSEIVQLTGGVRGEDPLASDYLTAWNFAQKRNAYPVKLFLDIEGNSSNTLKNLLQNYQPYAFGLTVVPFGSSVADAVDYRESLGIDYDNMALYFNFARIEDPYNNSSAWTSLIGQIGIKYAQTAANFDGLPPAGIDENGIGGQLNGFRILEMENDIDDTDDEQTLNEAQINPIVFDQDYGPMIKGNRTLQVDNSDTSFIHTRRIYNLILDTVSRQVLRKQEFKLNDDIHRLIAKTQTDTFLTPILAQELLRDAVVVCDNTNNTDVVLEQREFILDIYVKATPSSEFVTLRLTRLPQGSVVADFLS